MQTNSEDFSSTCYVCSSNPAAAFEWSHSKAHVEAHEAAHKEADLKANIWPLEDYLDYYFMYYRKKYECLYNCSRRKYWELYQHTLVVQARKYKKSLCVVHAVPVYDDPLLFMF